MGELSAQEVRELVSDLIVQKDEEYTWVTGEVELVTRSDGRVRGRLKSTDESSVVLATGAEDRRVCFADVMNVIVQMSSPGPE
jgi:hypothetical protein